MNLPPFFDISKLSEDQRITLMGNIIRKDRAAIGCLVDHNQETIDRYIRKMTTQFPDIHVVTQCPGPTKGVYTIKFGLKTGTPSHN